MEKYPESLPSHNNGLSTVMSRAFLDLRFALILLEMHAAMPSEELQQALFVLAVLLVMRDQRSLI